MATTTLRPGLSSQARDYKAIHPAWCKRSNGTRLTVLDLWRTLPADKFADVADVLYLGSGR